MLFFHNIIRMFKAKIISKGALAAVSPQAPGDSLPLDFFMVSDILATSSSFYSSQSAIDELATIVPKQWGRNR